MPLHSQIKNERNEILVWYLTEPEEWFQDRLLLSENELIKLNGISNPKMRVSFLCVRLMIKQMGLPEIFYQKNGKPNLEKGHISISHSGNWVVIQVSEKTEVGIDVEKLSNRILKIKDRFLSEEEEKVICNLEMNKMVLCWSVKEAVFKKHGGETVFFKENIRVKKINSFDKLIEIEVNKDSKTISEEYGYTNLGDDYVLVYTL